MKGHICEHNRKPTGILLQDFNLDLCKAQHSTAGPSVLFQAVLRDYGWAPQRDSNWDSLSGAQLFLGTKTNEKEPYGYLEAQIILK